MSRDNSNRSIQKWFILTYLWILCFFATQMMFYWNAVIFFVFPGVDKDDLREYSEEEDMRSTILRYQL